MKIFPPHRVIQRLIVWLVPLLLASAAYAANAAAPVHRHVSLEAYGRILNLVFPHTEPDAGVILYEMVLRFMSSKHSESEVLIDVYQTGKSEAWIFQVSGSSAWNIANEYIQRSGREDVEQIANLVRRSKRKISISPDQADGWHAACLKGMGKATAELEAEAVGTRTTGEVGIYLDGSTYELWFTQGATQIHWRSMDEEVNDSGPAGDSPVAKWMNDVRSYALTTPRNGVP
jgi:hypothetical protein